MAEPLSEDRSLRGFVDTYIVHESPVRANEPARLFATLFYTREQDFQERFVGRTYSALHNGFFYIDLLGYSDEPTPTLKYISSVVLSFGKTVTVGPAKHVGNEVYKAERPNMWHLAPSERTTIFRLPHDK